MLIKVWYLKLGGLCHFKNDGLKRHSLVLSHTLTFVLKAVKA